MKLKFRYKLASLIKFTLVCAVFLAVAVDGHVLNISFKGQWERESQREQTPKQRTDSCMDEERVIYPCSSFSAALPLYLTLHLWALWPMV